MDQMNQEAYRRLIEYNDRIKAIDQAYRNVAKQVELPECAFWILYSLRVEEMPLTQKDICDILYQPKQTVNSALKKLEAEGYICLVAGKDQRKKVLTLTEKGLVLAEKTVDRVAKAEMKALLALSEEEQGQLLSVLGKFNGLLREQLKNM